MDRRIVRLLLLGVIAVVALTGSVAAKQPETPEEIVFRSNRADGLNDLYLIGRDGSNLRRLTYDGVAVRTPRFSPDGTKIAFASTRAGNFDIWTINSDGTDLAQVTTNPQFEDNPSWTEAGELVFARGSFGCPPPSGCTAVAVDLAGGSERTLPIGRIDGAGLDASREDRILFTFDRAIWVADLDGSERRRLTSPPADQSDFRPLWAPKGKHFAFIRGDDVGNELWIGRWNEPAIQLTSTPIRHEEYPSWSASGDEILFMGFFAAAPGKLYRIAPDGSGDAEVSTSMHAPFVDTFSRDGRDASLWHQLIEGTEVTVTQARGRVEVTLGAAAVPGGSFNTIVGQYGSQCTLPGDFDIQVDYDALTWPATNGSDANLQAFGNAAVARESKAWGEQYAAWLSGPSGSATTEENAGSMRVVRSGGRFRAFWRYEGVWVPIRSAPANTNPVQFGFTLVSFNNQFAHQQVKVAFDNFRLASGAVSCPSWWASAFGDLG